MGGHVTSPVVVTAARAPADTDADAAAPPPPSPLRLDALCGDQPYGSTTATHAPVGTTYVKDWQSTHPETGETSVFRYARQLAWHACKEAAVPKALTVCVYLCG